jgi:hypothetical protein
MTCVPDQALIFQDNTNYCYQRINPTNNVREWGAKCDVVVVRPTSTATVTWNPSLVDTHMSHVQGALVVPVGLLPPPPSGHSPAGTVNPYPSPGQYITISQIGGPTLWVRTGTGVAPTATWATRYSGVGYYSDKPMHDYTPGDLVSFIGNTNSGTFSQQVAVIVDSVKTQVVAGVTYNGMIDKWHFLWGGLYDATAGNLPTSTHGATPVTDGTMVADATHSHLASSAAADAVLTPAWSGWSLLNNQTFANAGSHYQVGDTITLSESTAGGASFDGSTVNQGHYPVVVVEAVNGGGAVTAFDWLDYGSYYILPTTMGTITPATVSSQYTRNATGGPGSGSSFALGLGATSGVPLAWTRGPLATTIADVENDAVSGYVDIFVSEEDFTTNPAPYNAFPVAMPVQEFYYGDDDGAPIRQALSSQSVSAIPSSNFAAVSLPGACGTTSYIRLPTDASSNFVDPSLVGRNLESTGLYAFAPPLAGRAADVGQPVMNRLLYSSLAATSGGGFRDMTLEAMGLAEGDPTWDGVSVGIPEPAGYVGPEPYLSVAASGPPYHGQPPPLPAGFPTYDQIPTAGDAVEIDSAKYMRIRNVHVSDGGVGSGNSVFHCGNDEADPFGFVGGGGVGNIVVGSSRFDDNPLVSGPTDSDTTLRLGTTCHDSVYWALTVFDGVKADVLEYNGNLFSQLHLGADAVTTPIISGVPPAPNLALGPANSGFAGVPDYGAYTIQNTSFSQTQCDIVNLTCVLMARDNVNAYHNPGQITDTQLRCGPLPSLPPATHDVELGAGAANITVGGTASFGGCKVPPGQLILVDGGFDNTVSLCNNSNSPAVLCGGAAFAAGRAYTQPSLAYTSVALTGQPAGSGPTTLYAIPFINPVGGAITQLGINVVSLPGSGAATMCELGVYGLSGGLPGPLLLDGGPVSFTGVTPPVQETLTGLAAVLAPNTLYFLAVACDGAVTVTGTSGTATSGFAGLWLGEPDFISYGANNLTTGAWSFAPNGLPATFPSVLMTRTAADMPNVYVRR